MEKLGSLEYWTEDKIQVEIDSLKEWAKREDSICMAGWCAENTISTRVLYYLRDKSPIFRETHDVVKKVVANRLASKLGGKVHQCHYNKYQSFYDAELKDHEKEMATVKTTTESESRKDQMETAKSTQAELNRQLSERKMADSSISPEQKS